MSSKDIARDIFANTLKTIHPRNFINKHCYIEDATLHIAGKKYSLDDYKNLYIFGSGKAAFSMAQEIENTLGDKIYKGLVVSPYDNGGLKHIEVKIGSHPIPTQKSIDASHDLLKMMQECDEDDLYIYLLSGGSSALIEIPIVPITLEDIKIATHIMLSNNLEIHEINTIRKHISKLKGGRLAAECKASGEVLVISDIIDNDLYSIGSAPLYADKSSFSDAKRILDEKNIFSKMPHNIQSVIKLGITGNINESPKEPLDRVSHHIIASNTHAKESAKDYVLALGMSVKVVQEAMFGEVTNTVEKILDLVDKTDEQCIIFGGESTVELRGNGQGGRNQHAALVILKEIYERDLNISFLSAGTDGIDGNSDAAGAVVDKKSYIKAKNLGLNIDDYLQRFDSYNFFKQTGDIVITGSSGTNVIDVAVVIKGEYDG